MLARQRLRRFAVEALEDHSSPFGPSCECVGPLAHDCDGHPIEVYDSPVGHFGERMGAFLNSETESGLPLIAVYTEQTGAQFEGGQVAKVKVSLALSVEIYVTAESDLLAEDRLDDLQQKVMYRLMRRESIVSDGCVIPNMLLMEPSNMQVVTERDVSKERRVFMRRLTINVEACDSFEAPDCGPACNLCINLSTTIADG